MICRISGEWLLIYTIFGEYLMIEFLDSYKYVGKCLIPTTKYARIQI